jgi:hypothetical protein
MTPGSTGPLGWLRLDSQFVGNGLWPPIRSTQSRFQNAERPNATPRAQLSGTPAVPIRHREWAVEAVPQPSIIFLAVVGRPKHHFFVLATTLPGRDNQLIGGYPTPLQLRFSAASTVWSRRIGLIITLLALNSTHLNYISFSRLSWQLIPRQLHVSASVALFLLRSFNTAPWIAIHLTPRRYRNRSTQSSPPSAVTHRIIVPSLSYGRRGRYWQQPA